MDHTEGGRRGKGKRNKVRTQQLPEKSEGYDYEFVDSPPDEFICSICLSVLRDPNLISCCRNYFCQACIRRIKSIQKPCPLCREQNYTIMLDPSFGRKVKELRIRCPCSVRGCEWVSELGSLQKHLDVTCGFVEVTCDYCRRDDILRHSLADHRKYNCPLRPYRCEYCGLRDTWESITHIHLGVCGKYPIKCPNKCVVGGIPRIDFDKHVKEECPLGVVACNFKYAGCHVRLPRKDIGRHLSEKVSSHLEMVVMTFQQKFAEKDQVIDELRMKVEAQRREIAALTSTASGMTTNVQSQGKDILALTRNVQSQRKDILALSKSVKSQGKDVSTLTANFNSQGKDISKLRGSVQSLYRQTEELKASVAESHSREVGEETRQSEEQEAAVQSHPRIVEHEIDLQTILDAQMFQVICDIAARNRDLYAFDAKRVVKRSAIGAALGMVVGWICTMWFGGSVFVSIVCGLIGAIVAFTSGERKTVWKALSDMSDKQQQALATTGNKVAVEWDMDIVIMLYAKAILYNPRTARQFLLSVLHKHNIRVDKIIGVTFVRLHHYLSGLRQ